LSNIVLKDVGGPERQADKSLRCYSVYKQTEQIEIGVNNGNT